jgi:hypothetical protein
MQEGMVEKVFSPHGKEEAKKRDGKETQFLYPLQGYNPKDLTFFQ